MRTPAVRRAPLIMAMTALALGLAAWTMAQDLGEQNPTPPRKPGSPIIRSAASLMALHRSDSPQYDKNCTQGGCHAGILNRDTLSESVPEAHALVAQMGLDPKHCVFCHQSVDIEKGQMGARGNAGSLGKNVATITTCYPCHSPSGPGKQLYGPKKKKS